MITASEHCVNVSLWRDLVQWQWPHLIGRGICPVPFSLLGLATGLWVQREGGLHESGDDPALPVTAREQTQLCSLRTFGVCSLRLKPKVAALITRQPAARCFVQPPGEGLFPTADGNAEASLSFALVQDPQTQPISRVLLSVLVRGNCQIASYCSLEISSSLLGLVPSLSVAGALPLACSRAPFPFRANTGWPLLLAHLQHISQMTFFGSSFVSGG